MLPAPASRKKHNTKKSFYFFEGMHGHEVSPSYISYIITADRVTKVVDARLWLHTIRGSMEESDGKTPPAMISQEGPLRSITTPQFAGSRPVSFRDSGPFAQNQPSIPPQPTTPGAAAATTTNAPTVFPPPPGDRPSPSTTIYTPEFSSSPPLTNDHPRGDPSSVSQSPSVQPAPAAFDHIGDVFSTPVSSPDPFQFATPPAAEDLFARPPQEAQALQHQPPPQPPASDPLSHLLSSPVNTVGGFQGGTEGAGAPTLDYQNLPPPTPPEGSTANWGFAAAGRGGVNQDGFRDRAVPASPSSRPASGSLQAPGMPALPPPPQGFAASGYSTPTFSQQQPQQSPPVPPVAAAPPPPAPPASFVPPKERTLEDLVLDFLTPSAPAPPEAPDQDLAMGDPEGWAAALGRLARTRAWGTLVDAAGTMLVVIRGGGAPGLTVEQVTNVRLRRALGLLRLGRGAEAVEAATEVGVEGDQGPLAAVSVAARLAAAGAKAACGGASERDSVDELSALKLELEGLIGAALTSSSPPSETGESGIILSVTEAVIWRRRVMSTLANTFVSRGNWRLALGLLEAMGEEACAPEATIVKCCRDVNESEEALGARKREQGEGVVSACRVEVLSRIGRVFLQFGALKDAEVYFRRAEEAVVVRRGERYSQAAGDNPRILLNRGLLLFSKNDFVSAQENFEKAAMAAAASSHEQPNNSEDEWNWTVLDESTDLLGSALNNLSLAMVYSCDVMRGVRTLEGLIRKDPPLYMLDVVVFNLCTLYDLSFDAATSAAKKRTLQAVAQRFRLEDIDSSSFRTN